MVFFDKKTFKDVNPRGVLCILGGFILCLSFASDFSYPNLNTYLISYMRKNGKNPGLTYADFVFLSSTKVIIQGSSMPLIGILAKKVGVKPSIAIGSLIYSFGFLITYWTVKERFIFAILSLSLHGLGFSWVYATAVGAAQAWFSPRVKGLVGSIVLSGYGFGSLIWIPLQTAFVNPSNMKASIDSECQHLGTPEEEGGCDKYFDDPTVLERIPYMFLMLGGTYLGLCFISVLLISDAHQGKVQPKEEVHASDLSQDLLEKKPVSKEESPYSLTPTAVLKTPIFYKIWISFFALCLTNGLMGNYSKAYGLTFINDDHFFAGIGVVCNVFNGAGRIFWGLIYDSFNFKRTYLIMAVVVTLVTSSLPILPYLEADSVGVKAMYGFLMVLLYATFPGVYAVIAAAVADAFGPQHYQANFGLLFSNAVCYCLLIIFLTKVPIVYAFLGYTGMFLVAGGVGLIGILTAATVPTILSSEKYRIDKL